MRYLATAAFVTALSFGALSCTEPGSGSKETAGAYPEREGGNVPEERATGKQQYVQEAEKRLQALEAEIDVLKAKAEHAGAQAKVEMNRQLDELEAKAQQARAKLEELRASSEDAWQEFKSGLNAALEDLEAASERAKSKFE